MSCESLEVRLQALWLASNFSVLLLLRSLESAPAVCFLLGASELPDYNFPLACLQLTF